MINILSGFGVSGFVVASNAENGSYRSVSEFFDSGEFRLIVPWFEGTNASPLGLVIF